MTSSDADRRGAVQTSAQVRSAPGLCSSTTALATLELSPSEIAVMELQAEVAELRRQNLALRMSAPTASRNCRGGRPPKLPRDIDLQVRGLTDGGLTRANAARKLAEQYCCTSRAVYKAERHCAQLRTKAVCSEA